MGVALRRPVDACQRQRSAAALG